MKNRMKSILLKTLKKKKNKESLRQNIKTEVHGTG